MKSLKLITGAVLLFAATTLSAQDEADNSEDKSISFGVKAGVNFSTFESTNDDHRSQKARTGFHAGVVAEMPVTDIFSIQAEAMYSQQGFKLSDAGELSDNRIEYQVDYVNVPLLVKFYIVKGLSIEAGPQMGFKINEEIDNEVTDGDGDTPKDNFRDYEFGAVGGLTFQTDMGLFLSGRYNRGFTDLVKGQNFQNAVVQVSLGYKF